MTALMELAIVKEHHPIFNIHISQGPVWAFLWAAVKQLWVQTEAALHHHYTFLPTSPPP